MLQKLSTVTNFENSLVNKRNLKNLMYSAFLNYGTVKSSIIADRVKNLTFHYATQSGISLSVEDLRIPPEKQNLLGLTTNEVEIAKTRFNAGSLTTVERYQKTVDIWNNVNNFLKDEIVTYFRESDPLNPLYIMAFSGARGNISQVRQLVGMRGLMADPQGQIIDLPIKSNFREGLSITEYIISSYGARKGLVDTALRTADSGYLTRRLVDIAQDIIVREDDCGTEEGLTENELTFNSNDKLQHLIGRLLAVPLISKNGSLLAPSNTEIDFDFIKKFTNVEYKLLKVRSPLTCNSTRSVCRNCYGWHLSYSKLVDLGEAIGIIAAQSIGEPGTQLTMRTFHTGGVFSGDLNQHVRSPFPGFVYYSVDGQANFIRTMYGDSGFQLKNQLQLIIENSIGTKITFNLPPGSLLFKNNKQKVYKNEILAAIQKEANLISEENQEEIFSEKTGEIFFQNIGIERRFDKQNKEYKVAKSGGLIWVLQGNIATLKNTALSNLKPGLKISPNSFLNQSSLISRNNGYLKLTDEHINIKQFSVTVQNAFITTRFDGSNILTFPNSLSPNQFLIHHKPNTVLKNGDIIATLIDDNYKVTSGGIVTYSLESPRLVKKKKSVKTLFTGYCYFIPEETYYYSNSPTSNKFTFKTGDKIASGTEILPNIFSKISGYVFINEVTGEISIKPGEFLELKTSDFDPDILQDQFIQPGESILSNKLFAQKLIYIQFIDLFNKKFLFIRPVQTYEIPREKTLFFDQHFLPTKSKAHLQLKLVKRVLYKDWHKILPGNDLHLIKTSLVVELKHLNSKLIPKIEFKINHYVENKLILEVALNKKYDLPDFNHDKNLNKLQSNCQTVVSPKQYVRKNTILGRIQASSQQMSLIHKVHTQLDHSLGAELLILNSLDLRSIIFDSGVQGLFVKTGDLVKVGTPITANLKSPYAGQIYKITNQQLIIRLGQPVLISPGTILHVKNGDLIKKGERLATLIYEKLKTTDIVQGLPKVEEILEARKIINTALLAPCPGYIYLCNNDLFGKYVQIFTQKGESARFKVPPTMNVKLTNGTFVNLAAPITDGIISPHTKLDILFSYYKKKYTNYEACQLSFKYLQLFLVQEVQSTYRSQGVEIDNKHVEIIVKQMTRKIIIEDGGSTTFLPGEVLNFQQMPLIEKSALVNGGHAPTYNPILLGLTKASLNSDSFISAASFQETTRVLTEAAIEGRKDWLNGLKENVIIGRLIPAGTGFDYDENQEILKRENLEINLKVKQDFNTIDNTIRNLRK